MCVLCMAGGELSVGSTGTTDRLYWTPLLKPYEFYEVELVDMLVSPSISCVCVSRLAFACASSAYYVSLRARRNVCLWVTVLPLHTDVLSCDARGNMRRRLR